MGWRDGMAIPRLSIRPRSAFFVVLALAFVTLSCWSFADPLVSAPDEQAHIMRAYALDHGQLGKALTPPSKVLEDVTVPTSLYYTAIYPICWHTHDNIAASCSKPWPTSSAPATIAIYVDHYPPLYYLLVGTATYVSHERAGIYMMRLISSLMGAVMLALAAYAIARWSRRRSLYAGLVIALSPETAFLSSSVNPSGFEIMTAICLWTLVAILALEHRENPPRHLVMLLGAVATVFVLIRGLSPLWLALAGASIVTLVGPRALWRLVVARRDLRVAGGVVIGAALVAATWIFTQGTLNILPVGAAVPKTDSTFAVMRIVSGYVQGWLRETVGILGWLDTELPHVVYQTWYLVVIVALVTALVRGNWRERVVVASLSALNVIIPVALVTRQAKVLGVVWQGRDNLPLAVGAVIMALAVSGGPSRSRGRRAIAGMAEALRRRIGHYSLVACVGLLALADLASFYTNLRRYAVGRYGPKFFFLHAQGWSPPTGQFVTLLVYGLATAALAAVLVTWIWFTPRPDETP